MSPGDARGERSCSAMTLGADWRGASTIGAALDRAGGTLGVARRGGDSTIGAATGGAAWTIGADRDRFGNAFVTTGDARGDSTTVGACFGATAATGGAGMALEAAAGDGTFSGTAGAVATSWFARSAVIFAASAEIAASERRSAAGPGSGADVAADATTVGAALAGARDATNASVPRFAATAGGRARVATARVAAVEC